MTTFRTPRLGRVAALLPLGVAAFAALNAGCPGALQDPGRFTEQPIAADASGAADAAVAKNCPDVPQLLVTACGATAGCHTSTERQQGLDLQSPDPGSRLVGVSSSEGPGLLIDPSNPSNSVLYTKLTTRPPSGVRMPFGRAVLDDATIACVLDWVTSVAGGGGAAGTGTPPGTGAPEGTDSGVAPDGDDAGTDAATTTDGGTDPSPGPDASPDASPEASTDASTDDAPAD